MNFQQNILCNWITESKLVCASFADENPFALCFLSLLRIFRTPQKLKYRINLIADGIESLFMQSLLKIREWWEEKIEKF